MPKSILDTMMLDESCVASLWHLMKNINLSWWSWLSLSSAFYIVGTLRCYKKTCQKALQHGWPSPIIMYHKTGTVHDGHWLNLSFAGFSRWSCPTSPSTFLSAWFARKRSKKRSKHQVLWRKGRNISTIYKYQHFFHDIYPVYHQ